MLERLINGFNGQYSINENGQVFSFKKGIYLSHNIHYKRGYHSVNLKSKKESKRFLVHRLVASAFLDNPYCLPEVNHKNGDKSDNRVSNLEWVSSKENRDHAVAIGLHYTKPVQMVKDGVVLDFNSVSDCARFLNTDTSFIAKCAKNGRKARGFNIRFAA